MDRDKRWDRTQKAYNLLVQDGRLVVIDVPQVVDLFANPHAG